MTQHRRSLVATAPVVAFVLALTTTPAQAAGSRTGATRAAKRHAIAYVKRYAITLRASDLDILMPLFDDGRVQPRRRELQRLS